jgi:hypothetical protein
MPNKGPVRILFLDGFDPSYLGLTEEATITTEADLGNTDPFDASITFLENLIKTGSASYDMVILGGARSNGGPAKAGSLTLELRKKTIIVSEYGLSSIVEVVYKEMGFSVFMTRAQLAREIREISPFKR